MRFAVLGRTEVWDEDRLIELGPLRRRLVLAALLVDVGQVVPVDVLLDRVWDGTPPAGAAATLQTYVSRLRSALAGGAAPARVTTGARGYALDAADDDVDARRFGALLVRAARRRDEDPVGARALVTDALALWRGPAYDDFRVTFTQAEAARLHERRLDAHDLAASLDLALGRDAAAVADLGPLVVAEPFRESLRASLMLGLHRLGRSAEALQVYEDGRALLADELGADPAPALRDLHGRILRQDPELLVAPVAEPVVVAAAPAPVAGGETLVGREVELARLDSVVQRREGAGVVAVVGEAGVGKSRLVEEAAARARHAGFTVAWGRCWGQDSAPTLWPWVQAVRDLAAGVPAEALAVALAGRGAPVLTFAPDIGGVTPAPVVPTTSLSDATVVVFDAVVAFLADLARHRPLLLVLDDLQWADDASRHLVEYVAAHPDPRVSLLVTVRSPTDDPAAPDLAVLAALARTDRVHRLDVAPLAPAAVRELVAVRVGDGIDDATVDALHRRTGGNPFYIGEILRLVMSTGTEAALAEGIPDSVRGVIRQRVHRLPDEDQAMLQAAAVVGRTFDLDLLGTLTGADEDAVDEAVDRATEIGLLRTEPRTVDQHRFTHPLLQETLLDEIGPVRRVRLHRRVAAALEVRRSREGDAASPAERIAHHHARAGAPADLVAAARWYLMAADEALTRRAYPECQQVLAAAEAAAERAGGAAGATLHTRALYRLRSFHTLFDGVHSRHGNWTEHQELEVDSTLPGRDLTVVLHAWWSDRHGQNQLAGAEAVSARLRELGDARDDDLLRLAGIWTGAIDDTQNGHWPRAREAFERVETMVAHVEIPDVVFTPHPWPGVAMYRATFAAVVDDEPDTEALWDAARERARHAPVATAFIESQKLCVACWRGDEAEGRRAAAAAEHAITLHGVQMIRLFMAIPMAWAWSDLDPAEALAKAEPAYAALDALPGLVMRPWLRGLFAEMVHRAGDADRAVALAGDGLVEAQVSGALSWRPFLRRVRAAALAAVGADGATVEAEIATGIAESDAQGTRMFSRRLEELRAALRG